MRSRAARKSLLEYVRGRLRLDVRKEVRGRDSRFTCAEVDEAAETRLGGAKKQRDGKPLIGAAG